MGTLFFLLLSVVIGTVSSLVFRKMEIDHGRRHNLRDWARHKGFDFFENDDIGIVRQLQNFSLFRTGLRGKAENIIRIPLDLETGAEAFIFDYTYFISNGKSAIPISQTAFFVNDKTLDLPKFKLKPEEWYHQIAEWMGKKDIDFADDVQFSERFFLSGEYEDFVSEKFSPAVRQFIKQKPPMNVEGENFYMVAWKPKWRPFPKDIDSVRQMCLDLADLFKKSGKEREELLDLAEINLRLKELVEVENRVEKG